jgi:hypothetical protein
MPPRLTPFPPFAHHREAIGNLPEVPEDEEDAMSMGPAAAAATTTGISKSGGLDKSRMGRVV